MGIDSDLEAWARWYAGEADESSAPVGFWSELRAAATGRKCNRCRGKGRHPAAREIGRWVKCRQCNGHGRVLRRGINPAFIRATDHLQSERNEKQQKINEIIRGLPEQDAEVLRMHYLEWGSQDAQAHALGISQPTYSRALSRAKKAVADALLTEKQEP